MFLSEITHRKNGREIFNMYCVCCLEKFPSSDNTDNQMIAEREELQFTEKERNEINSAKPIVDINQSEPCQVSITNSNEIKEEQISNETTNNNILIEKCGHKLHKKCWKKCIKQFKKYPLCYENMNMIEDNNSFTERRVGNAVFMIQKRINSCYLSNYSLSPYSLMIYKTKDDCDD